MVLYKLSHKFHKNALKIKKYNKIYEFFINILLTLLFSFVIIKVKREKGFRLKNLQKGNWSNVLRRYHLKKLKDVVFHEKKVLSRNLKERKRSNVLIWRISAKKLQRNFFKDVVL